MVKVNILTDDTVRKRGFLAEHGLSLWIEKDNSKILFDTGQTNVYLHNAKKMEIDLSQTDFIILSHGHYDHCGGLCEYPFIKELNSIYLHPDALENKYVSAKDKKTCYPVGIPWNINKLQELKEKIHLNKEPVQITKDIAISGEIPNLTQFEEVPTNFLINKNNKYVHDMMLDEQMLIINDNNKLIVILGCSHPGVINSLKYAQKLFPSKQIYALIAGMHLEDVSQIRLQLTIQNIVDMGIQKVIPLHCTGLNAVCEMKRFLGEKCIICKAGDTIEI